MNPTSIALLLATSLIQTQAIVTARAAEVMPETVKAATPMMETAAQRDARMAWFSDARFGLFIHWGVYAVPAGEWNGKTNYGEWIMEHAKIPVSQYEKFADEFNPVKFDAKEWVRMAKDAGMKYIVITSKHHDGFGLWDSKLTDWDIGRTPFKRDPLKELAIACQEAGIKLCFYHSILDWYHPDWGERRKWHDKATGKPDMDRYTDYMKGQLKELLTGYGPIGILWFDGEWDKPWTHERGVDVYNFVRGLQPNIIVNNRVGKGRKGMQGMDKGQGVGDYGTPEQEIPAAGFGPGVAWESCMTMNNHWGYNKNDHNWKSTGTLIHQLCDIASKGGNYLLNVGPTSEGLIPQPSLERLAEVGQWMKVNSEAIYGTTATPFGAELGEAVKTKDGYGKDTLVASANDWRATTKPGKVYLIVFNWPTTGKFETPAVQGKITKAYLLADRKGMEFQQTETGVSISLPQNAPDAIASVICLETTK